jgi:hypothetical protein
MKLMAYVTRQERYTWRFPWYMGYVREVELCTQVAVIPLNLVMALWFCLLDGLRYQWAPTRWRDSRRAIRMAVERGRQAGFNQGQAYWKMKNAQDWLRLLKNEHIK